VRVDNKHIAAIMGQMYVESRYMASNAEDWLWDYPMHISPWRAHNPEYIPVYNIGDSIGWGLVQWTVPDRKEYLLSFATAQATARNITLNQALGDLYVQLDFLIHEATNSFQGSQGPVNFTGKYKTFLGMNDDYDVLTRYYFDNMVVNPDKSSVPDRIAAAKKIIDEFGY